MTIRLIGCPKAVMVSLLKLSFIFARFIDSFESRKQKRDITGNDVIMHFRFGGTYGDGYCSSSDSCHLCTVIDFILVVTFCEDSLIFFFLTKTFLEDIEARFPAHCFTCFAIENGYISGFLNK